MNKNIKTVYLIRNQRFKSCTRGILVLPNGEILYTLERPWLDNRSNVSCIPTGKYTCKWHKSPTFGWVYKLSNVTGRTFILFHSGNIARNTKGCILIGSRLGYLGKHLAVLSSKPAVRKFFNLMDKQDFILEVY